MAETRPIEAELKFGLPSAAAGERFLIAEELGPFRPSSPIRTEQHEDRYLDTADRALARAGFAARLRQTHEAAIVTVKSLARDDAGGALHRREELEGVADRSAEPLGWPPSQARALILELCGDAPLIELVTVRQLRRKRELDASDARAEMSLDEVDIIARSRIVERFAELEVELIDGNEARLSELAVVLEATERLPPATGSKLERALAAIGPPPTSPRRQGSRARGRAASRNRVDGTPTTIEVPRATPPEQPAEAVEAAGRNGSAGGGDAHAPDASPPAPETPAPSPTPDPVATPKLVVGKTPGVLADDSIAEAGRKVLRFHFARMLLREPGTRLGRDAEELHGMRVATRRQRAAWRIFGDGFRPGRTKRHRSRLREVAGRLGAVRDLDVMIELAEAYRARQPVAESVALRPLLDSWREQRNDARQLLLRELDSDSYRRWVEEYREFVRREGAGVADVSPTRPHRIRDRAASRVMEAYEEVRAYEPVMRWADVETLHDLRIAAKWLRYTLEFIRETLEPGVGALITKTVALQDHLGELHDADVAAGMARTFLVENAGRLSTTQSAAIGRFLVDREKELARLRRTVGPAWRGVAGLGFRRALGRSLAQL